MIAGTVLALTRDRGSLFAFACIVVQTLTEESGFSQADDMVNRRSATIGWLDLLICGITCILMDVKKKPVVHR